MLGVEARLVKGASGVFDVAADGKLVFSKFRERRFPSDDEVIAALRSLK